MGEWNSEPWTERDAGAYLGKKFDSPENRTKWKNAANASFKASGVTGSSSQSDRATAVSEAIKAGNAAADTPVKKKAHSWT